MTAESRARLRDRRLLISAGASVVAKLVSASVGLLTVPLTLHYLGAERFGLWMTINSTVGLLGLADLGMGQGLLNALARANGSDDREAARGILSSALMVLWAFAGILMVITAILTLSNSGALAYQLLSVKDGAGSESVRALLVVAIVLIVNVPVSAVRQVNLALQQGYLSESCQVAASLTSIPFLFFAIRVHSGLPVLAFCLVFPPVLFQLVSWAWLLTYTDPWLRPSLRSATWSCARELLKQGTYFLGITICAVITVSSDNLIIARLLGHAAVTAYSVPFRLLSSAGSLVSMLTQPLWGAYTEAHVRGDSRWLKQTFIHSLVAGALLSGLPMIVLVCFMRRLIGWWIDKQFVLDSNVVVALALWIFISQIGYLLSTCLCAIQRYKLHFYCTALMTVMALPARIVFVQWLGLSGIVWGLAIVYTVTILIPYSLIVSAAVLRNPVTDRQPIWSIK